MFREAYPPERIEEHGLTKLSVNDDLRIDDLQLLDVWRVFYHLASASKRVQADHAMSLCGPHLAILHCISILTDVVILLTTRSRSSEEITCNNNNLMFMQLSL